MNRKISYKANANIVYSCKYHIVWCTKYRKALLVPPIDAFFKDVLLGVVCEKRSEMIELEVMPDHVHALIEVDPQFGVNVLIKLMKGRSSKKLREVFDHLRELPSLWTNSYFVSTVGGAPLHIIKQYIENQKYV